MRSGARTKALKDRGPVWQLHYLGPYRKLMGDGALDPSSELLVRRLRSRSRRLSVDDITQMLTAGWREQVMGAWYAIARADQVFAEPVHRAFTHCYGRLSAPALTAAVMTYANQSSVDVLTEYRQRDMEGQFGSADLVSAAISRLQHPAGDSLVENEQLDGLLALARKLESRSARRFRRQHGGHDLTHTNPPGPTDAAL